MKLGEFNIDIVSTGLFALDGGAVFGVVPKNIWSKAYHQSDDKNRVPLSARILLIRWADRILLIDTGNGTKYNEKEIIIYNFDIENSDINYALNPYNIKPEDVTDVILTHLHFDHAGAATIIKNKQIIPSFPNAKYYIQKDNLLWANNPTEKDRASYLKENFECIDYNNMFVKLDGDGEIFPGISVIQMFGHTKAMQLVKIQHDKQVLLHAADLLPTSAHIPTPYIMAYDNFPMTTLEEKKKILGQAYEENWTIFYEHDAFKQATNIISTDKGFIANEEIIINS